MGTIEAFGGPYRAINYLVQAENAYGPLRTTSIGPPVGEHKTRNEEINLMSNPTQLVITYGEGADGKRYATINPHGGDDIIGARAGTDLAAVLRAIELFFTMEGETPGDPEVPAEVALAPSSIRTLIEYAIRHDGNVIVTYCKENGEISLRDIEPYRIFESTNGADLVEAFDRGRGQIRNFRLDRIQKAEV